MEYCLIEKWILGYTLPKGCKAIAISPNACYELENAEIDYLLLDDFHNVNEEKKIELMLKESRQYPERPLLLVKPGTRIAKWGWKLENFGLVAEKLSHLQKAEVFFICAPGEETLIDKINERTSIQVGRLPILSIKELALTIKKSNLLFCNHTGIMHIASAVETPVVVIFKHGEILRWGPVHTQHVLLEERNSNTLSPEVVIKNIDQLLSNTLS